MRTLYYVPILHSSVESTGAYQMLAITFRDELGNEERHLMDIWLSQFWHIAKRRIVTWLVRDEIRAERFHVFVDGLPVARDRGNTPILYGVERPAGPHEPMRNLVYVLVSSGAALHGTEDPELIRRCREHVERNGPVWTAEESDDPWLVRARDAYIARNIHETLPDGHSAVLFVGANHLADKALHGLDPDLRIVYVMENPVSGAPATPLTPRA